MANGVFNSARGRIREKVINGGAAWGVMLLKTVEADDTLSDYDTIADLLAAAGNVECDFTNYARKTGLSTTQSVDDVNNSASADLPDQTWTSAGGAVNNTVAKAIIFFEESASDAGRIPCTYQDFVAQTDGNDLVAQVASGGYYQSA